MMDKFFVSLVALAMLVGVVGCKNEDDVVRAPLRGTVTFQGKPVAGGRVNLTNAPQGAFLTADITESGTYEVRTYRGSGLPLGTYKVAVSPPAGDPNDVLAEEPEHPDFPQKYRSAKTSGLTYTVLEGKDNQYDIDMTVR